MSELGATKSISVEQAVRAQAALRNAAGLGPETFPVDAFVGMISDEIQVLRRQGRSDADIASLIASHSEIAISPNEIAEHYAPPEQRHPERE